MKIGIDLDNTIIDYSKAFLPALSLLGLKIPSEYKTKDQIKNYLLGVNGGQVLWEQVQGYIYGPMMNIHAQLYPGLMRFLWRCKNQGHQVEIVSHKSIFGHYTSQDINIRDCANIFLEKCLVYIPEGKENFVDNVQFFSSKDEKIEFINSCDYDFFIDDLPDIVEKLALDSTASIIYFSHSSIGDPRASVIHEKIICLSDWTSIDILINGSYTSDQVTTLSTNVFGLNIKEVIKIDGGRNALVYQLRLQDGDAVKLKIYPGAESRYRLSREFTALSAIGDIPSKYTAKPISKNQTLEMALYEWVPGSPAKEYSRDDIFCCLKFLRELKGLDTHLWRDQLGDASAACFCYSDIKQQIFSRINELKSFNSNLKSSSDLKNFLEGEFLDQFEYFQGLLINDQKSYKLIEKELPENQRVLSPSDFGSHNAIRSFGGNLVFIDFEYFGYDDPAKLICDFLLHPAMDLTITIQHLWLEGAILLYGEKVWERVKAMYPFFALIWVLIIIKNRLRKSTQSEYQVIANGDLIIDDWVRFQYFNSQMKKLQNITQLLK